MTTDDPAGNRHPYGPRPLGALVPKLTRAAFRSRSPAAVQVMTDWAEIVGPALAAVTAPRRLASGTLTIACAGPVALELQHLAGQLSERINGHLGRVLITRLRFVQDLDARAAPPPPPRRTPAAPIDVPGIPPGPLRDALSALGAAVASRSTRDPA